ncbi:hypothetical protein TCAL_12102 [Tigriopus californicus]|uniref:Methyltransferase FkbM domain-containing protein n=1 Tax=Tigriopus californicus TaxID=6832 RepID=A0A553PQN9_TIGCA|nr:uncharacterized protein LOC131882631 [Tigriopus californicus]TRY79994.1 hypothetical protein TCAL_12102 [Tigriopus californicus]
MRTKVSMNLLVCALIIGVTSNSGDHCHREDVACIAQARFGNIDESLNSLQQDDPKLIEAIKATYLIPPSKEMYNFTNKANINFNGQYGQPLIIDKMFNNKLKKGFFIEAGAFDGEVISNSLRFEIFHQWSGLLVEPNPEPFAKLKTKNRRAWLLPNCFSTKTTPEVVEFDAAGLFGGIINPKNDHKPADFEIPSTGDKNTIDTFFGFARSTITIQCFPLYSVLLALGNPTVHYLTLDIEGAELPVLKTIPFDKVDIKILDIESNHFGEVFEGSVRDMARLLKKAGYYRFRDIEIDQVWVKNDFEVNPDAKDYRP